MAQTTRRQIRSSAATGIDLSLVWQVEEPGAPYVFDMMRGMAREVPELCKVEDLIEGLKGVTEDEARVVFSDFGKRLMGVVIELADGKYSDRTGQLIERVAERTGIWFPDRLRRYVELAILSSKPVDRWNVTRATRNEVIVQEHSCSVLEKLKANGLLRSEEACVSLCLACFEAAATKIERQVKIEARKHLSKDGMCEFRFTPGI